MKKVLLKAVWEFESEDVDWAPENIRWYMTEDPVGMIHLIPYANKKPTKVTVTTIDIDNTNAERTDENV